MSTAMLQIHNDGQCIVSTNYWQIVHDDQCYFSVNARAIRMLAPRGLVTWKLCEPAPATTVVVTKYMHADGNYEMDVVFDDGTEHPYSMNTTRKQWDRHIAASDSGKKDVVFSVWVAGPIEVRQFPCEFYAVIPTMPVPVIHAPKVKIGRNAPCPCGSGKKYKRCHGKA